MKKNLLCLFAVGVLLFTFFSCAKNNSDPSSALCRVVALSFDSFHLETRQQLDQDGNVLRMEDYIRDTLAAFSVFYYTPGKVLEQDTVMDERNKASDLVTYIIGANGYASSKHRGGRGYETEDSTLFTYDANGYMATSQNYHYTLAADSSRSLAYKETHTFVVVNGVRTEENVVYEGGNNEQYNYKAVYTYSDTVANHVFLLPNIVSTVLEFPFMGKLSNALITRAAYTKPDGTPLYHYDYSYGFDAAGKPVKAYFVYSGSGSGFRGSLQLEYNCP
ncbi:hypothetical protein SAMN05421788_11155 [Filimonas lacunae]|uniref:YD repeat-containing protein n=1 Tax=Filimonas lacunae TaxID=477680 RepID=A0A173MB41_9BACT|nr:hypothetical protein [Filimonas lacunae]BAV04742.1 hypothetical protein FLA_0741 [Filimonas lacunae]SIT32208.1 hypothetical protein SAMN05421788_11155 [Filimonas lacunae]